MNLTTFLTVVRHGRHVQDTSPKKRKINVKPMMSQISLKVTFVYAFDDFSGNDFTLNHCMMSV